MVSELIKVLEEELNNALRHNLNHNSHPAPEIRFLSSPGTSGSLSENAIYLVLFSCRQEQSLTGGVPYRAHESAQHHGDLVLRKPPLNLSLNLLLIFNLSHYEDCLRYYQKVIAALYTLSFIEMPRNNESEQKKCSIDIVMSNFSAREEIEIWNSFNVSGAPLLRYELNFVEIEPIANMAEEIPAAKGLGAGADPNEKMPPEGSKHHPDNKQLSNKAVTGFASVFVPVMQAQTELISRQIVQFLSFRGADTEVLKANWSVLASRLQHLYWQYDHTLSLLQQEAQSNLLAESEQKALKQFEKAVKALRTALPEQTSVVPKNSDLVSIYQQWCQAINEPRIRGKSVKTAQYLLNQLHTLRRGLTT